MAENMAELCSIVGREVELVGNTLEYFAQRFPSSTEVSASFSLLLAVKCEREKINRGRNCKVQSTKKLAFD